MKHDPDHAHGDDVSTGPAAIGQAVAPISAGGSCCDASTEAVLVVDGASSNGVRFRVPSMDCASEESEIRRALEGIVGIKALSFRLGERSLRIDAAPEGVTLPLKNVLHS